MPGSPGDRDPSLLSSEAGTVRIDEGPPSARSLAVSSIAPGVLVDGRYRVEGELGRGGMGIVYLAREVWLDRPLALKVIAPTWAGDEDAALSFRDEAKALASVRSQHVVQVYAFGVHQHAYYFAMEYVHGRSLRTIIAEHHEHGEYVPIHRALTILAQIADGLDAVHAAGLVHRDVKPANILIEEDTGRPVLADFGLAAHGGAQRARRIVGTPRYMAPEQLRGTTTLGPQADVYALGCVAFRLLTGRAPFDDRQQADLVRHALNRPAPDVSSVRPELAVFDEVVARALRKSPGDRYERCTAFSAELLRAGGRVGAGRRLPLTEVAPPTRSPGPLRALVVDDDPVSRKFAVAAVQLAFSLEVSAASAASGVEAIGRAQQELPDLVILDYEMPGLDGADTLSRLRSLPGGNRMRVLVLSGHVGEHQRWRFSVLGVRDFATKPIDFRHLVQHIEQIGARIGYGRKDVDAPGSS